MEGNKMVKLALKIELRSEERQMDMQNITLCGGTEAATWSARLLEWVKGASLPRTNQQNKTSRRPPCRRKGFKRQLLFNFRPHFRSS
jgi:hypothetical protein